MVELEKYLILRAKNFLNLGVYQFYKIFEILQGDHIVQKDIKTFYINNYID